ncbi:unnamed protein product [Caenorhabditis angaria]|uniref:Uncharacterized protein n=1 Tax=Caenorhabditis angaria TaxID=860376 RepID=A0A9P1N0N2_9PELO|nr:unnamed protein product [Caenorhabditis angaria]
MLSKTHISSIFLIFLVISLALISSTECRSFSRGRGGGRRVSNYRAPSRGHYHHHHHHHNHFGGRRGYWGK